MEHLYQELAELEKLLVDTQKRISEIKDSIGEKIIVNLNITTFCQSKCEACPRTNRLTGEKIDWLPLSHIPLEDIKLMINNMCSVKKQNNHLTLKLCGDYGDPMMHPDIEHIIYYAELQIEIDSITISTNGGIRNKSFYEKIAKSYGKTNMTFGIDGIDAETNDKYRKDVNFKRAWENMVTYHEETMKFGDGTEPSRAVWQFLIFKWNKDQIEDAYNIANSLGIEIDAHLGNGTTGDIELESEIRSIDNRIDDLERKYYETND